MRFTSIIVSGLVAVATAQTTTSPPPTSVGLTPAQESQAACLGSCKAGDVNCQAHCITVPSPDTKQVNDTTACVAKCPQGDGSKAQTETYRKCTDKCIADNYYVSSVGTPQPTGGAGSGGNGGSKGGNGGDDESASGTATGSADATKSGTASPSSSDNAAGTLVGSSATLFGLFAAMLAL